MVKNGEANSTRAAPTATNRYFWSRMINVINTAKPIKNENDEMNPYGADTAIMENMAAVDREASSVMAETSNPTKNPITPNIAKPPSAIKPIWFGMNTP